MACIEIDVRDYLDEVSDDLLLRELRERRIDVPDDQFLEYIDLIKKSFHERDEQYFNILMDRLLKLRRDYK